MEITGKIENNIGKLYLDGRFDANTAEKVEKAIKTVISKGTYRIILDLSKVPFIASAGLRVVLASAKLLRQTYKGDLRIAALQPGPEKVFEISGLNNVLKLFPTVENASKNF